MIEDYYVRKLLLSPQPWNSVTSTTIPIHELLWRKLRLDWGLHERNMKRVSLIQNRESKFIRAVTRSNLLLSAR